MLALKRHELREPVARQLRNQSVSGPGILRICLPVASVDPLAWLQGQTQRPHWFWQSRGQDAWMAGVGVTHCLNMDQGENLNRAMAVIQQILAHSDEGVRYVGGMAFDPRLDPTGPWRDFGRFLFFVPRVLLEGNQGQTRLVLQYLRCAAVTPERVLADLADLAAPSDCMAETWPWPIRSDHPTPDPGTWCHRVQGLLTTLDQRQGKLVPACCREITAEQNLEPHAILAALRGGRDAYQFYLGLKEAAFLGRSPELLYQRYQQDLHSEALAGTAHGVREETLLHSAKDNAEQDYVIRDLQEAMGRICYDVRVSSEKEVVGWGRLAHLKSSLQGRLKPGLDDAAILQVLHPTAAVLGYPRAQAWDLLQAFETIYRGWYAGPIGWVARERAEFAVAIRSALCHGKALAIYAGAGIVKGSNPEQEWQEIRNKMRPYVDLFETSNTLSR